MDVEPFGERPVVGMCHRIEDPTFDATVSAINPKARCRPVHRPPRSSVDQLPHCRWEVVIDDDAEPLETRECAPGAGHDGRQPRMAAGGRAAARTTRELAAARRDGLLLVDGDPNAPWSSRGRALRGRERAGAAACGRVVAGGGRGGRRGRAAEPGRRRSPPSSESGSRARSTCRSNPAGHRGRAAPVLDRCAAGGARARKVSSRCARVPTTPDVALVQLTSGTTGPPKPVPLRHSTVLGADGRRAGKLGGAAPTRAGRRNPT